jgi:hypothetical protein
MSSTRLAKLREVSGGRITRQNLFDAALIIPDYYYDFYSGWQVGALHPVIC